MKFRLLALGSLATAAAVVAVRWREIHALPAAAPPLSPAAVAAPEKEAVKKEAPDALVARCLTELRTMAKADSGPRDGASIRSWLEPLSPWQLRLAASALKEEPELDSGLRETAVVQLLKSLSGKDPYGALEVSSDMAAFFHKRDFQEIASEALPRAMSDAPDETAAWFMAHARDLGECAAHLPREMLAWAARRQPDLAFRLIGKLHLTDLRDAGEDIGEAVDEPSGRTPVVLAMRIYLSGLGDEVSAEKLRQGVLGGVSSKLHHQSFEESLRWIEAAGLDLVEQRSLAEALRPYEDSAIPTAGDDEMADWLGWIGDKVTPDRLPGKVEDLVRSWARWFPDAAARWIEAGTGGVVKEAAVRGFVEQTALSSPDQAVRVAMLLPEGRPRLQALRTIEDARTLKYGYQEERPGE